MNINESTTTRAGILSRFCQHVSNFVEPSDDKVYKKVPKKIRQTLLIKSEHELCPGMVRRGLGAAKFVISHMTPLDKNRSDGHCV